MVDASVLIVGGGAVGGILAGVMQGAVRRVVVLDTNAEHVARMRAGLRVDRLDTRLDVPVPAFTSAGELGDDRFDLALLTVKATGLDAALASLRDVAIDTYVSLGNGLVQDAIADAVGDQRLVAGTVELGATNHGAGHVQQTTANPFVIGELDGSTSHRIALLGAALETVEPVRVTDNVWGQIWSKLLLNSTFSGLGAVGGCLYGDLAADPLARRALRAVWSEGHAVATAEGRVLDTVLGIEPADLADGDEAADRAIDGITRVAAATKASMVQDLERGVPTEVDVINGAVVARGARHGVPTPLNARIVELVHAYERGELRPAFQHVRSLAG
jgi:2-dehydropantoate 2-reductase